MTEERRAYFRAYYAANKVKHRAAVDRWKAKNKDKVREIQRRSRVKNRAKRLVTTREWKARNTEKVKEYDRIKRIRHKAKILARQRRWYEANRARKQAKDADRYRRISETVRQRSSAWYRSNPEQAKISRKQWREANPDKVAAAMVQRKARIRSATVGDCSDKIIALRRKTSCHWCGYPLTRSNFSIDHVMPIIRGGAHAPDNLVAACRTCNSRKQAKLPHEWRGEALPRRRVN